VGPAFANTMLEKDKVNTIQINKLMFFFIPPPRKLL
jgi:hypothetical protein